MRTFVLSALGILVVANASIAAKFTSLGFLNVGNNVSHVAGLSADGRIVLGESYEYSAPDGLQDGLRSGALFRWSATGGMSDLVQPPSPGFSGIIEPRDRSFITAVSRDGNAILVDRQTYESVGPDDWQGAFSGRYLWSPIHGLQSGPLLIDAHVFSNGLSRDGRKRVGWVSIDMYRFGRANSMAVVWGDDDSWLPLGRLPADPSAAPMSKGIAMSADGSVVVGHSTSVNAPGPSNSATFFEAVPIDQVTVPPRGFAGNSGYEAFVWTQEDGMTGLGDLPGGSFESSATGVSSDGRFIIGGSSVDDGREGFVWTKDGGMIGLGFLNPDYHYSGPAAVSNNGVIVGQSLVSREILESDTGIPYAYYQDTSAAFIWDVQHGMRNLKDVLEQEHGLDLSGWQLTSAVGISEDGLTIAGNGINPFGQQEGWIVRLQSVPEPSTFALLAAAVCSLIAHRRRMVASSTN